MTLFRLAALCILLMGLAACGGPRTTTPAPRTADGTDLAYRKATEAFTADLAGRFRRAAPGWTIREEAPLTLAVEPGAGRHTLTVSLERIFFACLADQPRCTPLAQEYVARTVASVDEMGAPIRAAALRTVLRPESYLAELRRVLTGGSGPVAAPFLPGVVQVAVADTPNSMRVLRQDDLGPLGLSAAQALALGARNVAAELGSVPEPPADASATDVLATGGSSYASSRLLDHRAWAVVAARGGVLLVAAPSADLVLVGRGDSEAGRRAFAQAVAHAYARAQRPISEQAWRWTVEGWREIDLRPRA